MYSRDVIIKKCRKMSNFSVVTKISTNGYTLKLTDCPLFSRFYCPDNYENYKFIAQIAVADDNKGVFDKFRKNQVKKSRFLTEKNQYKIL